MTGKSCKILYRAMVVATIMLILFLPSAQILAQSPEARPVQLKMLESTSEGITIELVVPAYAITETARGDMLSKAITLPESGKTSEPGKPQLPMVSTLIGIPGNAKLELILLDDRSELIDRNLDLITVPQPARASEDLQPGSFETIAGSRNAADDQWYPSRSVTISDEGWLRDQRVARIEFYPFQYRPSDGQVVWHRSQRVSVRFIYERDEKTDVGFSPTEQRAESGHPYEVALRQNLINYETAKSFRTVIPSKVIRSTPWQDWVQEGEPRYRIEVDNDGLYRLAYNALQAAGLDVAGLDPTLLHLTSQGDPVAIFVENEDGNEHDFGPSEVIYFYGQKFYGERLAQRYAGEASNYLVYSSQLPDGTITTWHPQFSAEMLEKYTDTNVYWLSLETTPGLRMQVADGTPHDTAPVPTSYITTVHAEQSKYWYTFNFTSEDTWYWDEIRNSTQRSYTTTLTTLAPEPFSATLRGEIVARNSNINYNPDHHTRLWINSQATPFNDTLWDGISRYRFEELIPQSQLVEGLNQLKLTTLVDAYPGQPADWLYFDWYDIEYHRRFQAENDRIIFSRSEMDATWQYQVSGFTSPGVFVLDIANPLIPKWIANQRFTSGNLAYEARHVDKGSYLAAGINSVQNPKSITFYDPPNLLSSSNRYDYIFITHQNFVAATQPLADFHASQGLRTLIVDVNDLYNEFNYGIYHSIAIKNFLAYTFAHWAEPPTYVLLIGDGHWNFKAYPRYNAPPIYMPPHLGWIDPWQGEMDSANMLAAVVGADPLPDVLIGRLPVNNVTELNAATTKIINYEQSALQGWQNKITFIADNVPDPAGDFVEASERMIADYIEPGYTVNRIYENDYNCPGAGCSQVNQAIISTMNNTGSFLINFAGHGALNRWSQESIFVNADILSLTNANQLPVILSVTCLDGYWIHPGLSPTPSPSIIEEMVRAQDKGAVSTFSPTGLGVSTGHDELWRGFYDSTFRDGNWILGEAALAAKLRLYATGGNLDLVHTYTIFGDPALRIKTPYRFTLASVPDGQQHLPGSVVQRTIRVTNSGLVPDTYSTMISGNQWVVTIPGTIGPVAPGVTLDVPVIVYTSLFAPNGTSDVINITITSLGDRSKQAGTTLITTVNATFVWRLIRLPQVVK